jgi:hypothetical protein
MNAITLIQSPPHGLACDGCGVAKDDLLAIETMEKQEDLIHELFHNAARIHKAMRSNHLLRPIFRKYREACREILQNKKDEAEQLAMLSEYCDECTRDPHQANEDLKYIQSEMGEIHDQIKSIEEMQWTDDDDSESESESESESDSEFGCSDSEDNDGEIWNDGPDSSSQSEQQSESSDSDTESDLSEVIEFLRQSQFE